jgi:hypothetical protein
MPDEVMSFRLFVYSEANKSACPWHSMAIAINSLNRLQLTQVPADMRINI